MSTRSVTVQLPEMLYARLQHAAQATRRPLQEILVHAVEVGSPPRWDDVPAPFQADLAALDRLDDDALWHIAHAQEQDIDMERYQALLDKNANASLPAAEREELERLRIESDRFMLCKAQAIALLRWRGHTIPLKSEVLANIYHELRPPLNVIIGFSRVILKGIDGPLTDMQKTDLEAILSSGKHLLNLINDTLDISRIEADKMGFVFEATDIAELAKTVINSTAIALVKDLPVELISEIPDEVPMVLADARRIRQVIAYLLKNAAKFTEEGFIRLAVEYDDQWVTVSVQDTGIGIPKEHHHTIFREFKPVNSSSIRGYVSTGLGLPLSKKFIEVHRGKMWFESVGGQGSTFYFSLPISGNI